MRSRNSAFAIALSLVFLLSTITSIPSFAKQSAPELQDWGVPEGYALAIDSTGYVLPTGIAFVPNPGTEPNDPLYFVTELRGTVKVVTNDRSVYIFAEDFLNLDPDLGLEVNRDEFGLTGICLASQQGFVFVTYGYVINGQYFNGFARFETNGTEKFSLSPSNLDIYNTLFADFPTNRSHQIGNCKVNNDQLYVGIGDGLNKYEIPVALEIPLGKILRFTLDGKPYPENSFVDPSQPGAPENYVFATGFRNPFGIEIVEGRIFIADNGIEIDRLLEVDQGIDYLWNGLDSSIASIADVLFTPPIAPTQMTFASRQLEFMLPEDLEAFYIASTGKSRGVTEVHLDLESNRATMPPGPFISYVGKRDSAYSGTVAGVAVGPDGLYFSSLLPHSGESASVFKAYYDPPNQHQLGIRMILDPIELIEQNGCLGCHTLHGQGGEIGPALDFAELSSRLSQRLNSLDYLASLEMVNSLDEAPFIEYAMAREEIRALQDTDKLLLVWTKYHLLEPRFDEPDALMPNPGLHEEQAVALAEYLLTPPEQEPDENDASVETPGMRDQILASIPKPRFRHVALFFVLGILLGSMGRPIIVRVRHFFDSWRTGDAGDN